MTARLVLCALLASATAACPADDETFVFVTVDARVTVPPATTLRVEVENAGGRRTQDFALPAGAAFPVTFTVTPTGREGDITIGVAALDGTTQVGRGSVTGPISEGRTDLTLTLAPDDFSVNRIGADTQWISFIEELGGRQIGVDADGTFLIAWENSCPLSRCDILARLFGPDTVPLANGTTLTPDDFIVQQSPEYTESPSVVAGVSGWLIAWLGAPDFTMAKDVKATALTADAGHAVAFDTSVTFTAEDEAAPNALALADGNFVVLWQRIRPMPATGTDVRGRVLDSDGNLTGAEFGVSVASTGDLTLPHGVGLVQGGFVAVWIHRNETASATNVRARAFNTNGQPTTPLDVAVTTYPDANVFTPRAAAAPDGGFLVAWQAFAFGDTLLDDYPLWIHRFSETGMPLGGEILVAAQTIDFGAYPSVAVRGDGAIGVAWHDCGERGDANGCGIRFRLFHPNGLPCGEDEIVNTTLEMDQRTPTIVGYGEDAFLLGWTDGSMVPPDTQGSGIRARVIYPSLERHDGAIGARCGGSTDAACGANLTCVAGGPEAFTMCHPVCVLPEGTACPEGGACRQGACLFE